MPLYDARCTECSNEYEELRKSNDEVSPCPKCGGKGLTIWRTVPILNKAKDPFDLLNGPIPDSRTIKSFGNDRRKGGKDTT